MFPPLGNSIIFGRRQIETLMNKALRTARDNLIALYVADTLKDGAGAGGAINSAPTGAAYNATHSAVTIGTAAGSPIQGAYPGLYNGSTSFTQLPAAALDGVYNGNLLSFVLTVKLLATPSNRGFFRIGLGGNYIELTATSGTVYNLFRNVGGVVARTHTFASQPTGYVTVAGTVNQASDRMRLYINGIQSGADVTGLSVHSGTLVSAFCVIGASNNTPTAPINAAIGMFGLWNVELAPAQVSGFKV